jgi:hypothetical protein
MLSVLVGCEGMVGRLERCAAGVAYIGKLYFARCALCFKRIRFNWCSLMADALTVDTPNLCVKIEDPLFNWFVSFGVWVCGTLAAWEQQGVDLRADVVQIREWLWDELARGGDQELQRLVTEQKRIVDAFHANMAIRKPNTSSSAARNPQLPPVAADARGFVVTLDQIDSTD